MLAAAGCLAVLGCVLPWERLRFSGVGLAEQTNVLSAARGSGLAACIGAVLTLLCLAHRIWRPGALPLRDGASALAGALLVAGSALYTTGGGYRPASGPGYAVTLGPGLFCAGIAGVLLIAATLLATVQAPSS